MFIQNHLISTRKQGWALRCQRQQFISFEYSNRIENFTCSEWKNNKPEPIRSLVGWLPSALFACIAVVHQVDDVLQMLGRLKQSNKKILFMSKASPSYRRRLSLCVCAPRLYRWRWQNGMNKSKWLTIRLWKFSAWTQRTHPIAFERRMAKIICDAISDIRYLHFIYLGPSGGEHKTDAEVNITSRISMIIGFGSEMKWKSFSIDAAAVDGPKSGHCDCDGEQMAIE